jgi:hypothetical protein
MLKLAHIVNPVTVPSTSDLLIAQPITFETMRIAKAFARDQVDVALFSAQYFEDRSQVPPDFQTTPDLTRSILDLGNFYQPRKLPLIQDILDRLDRATHADYLIYTNVDIALMPHFYVAVAEIIAQGYDAFVINRRTISKTYQKVQEISLMYSEIGVPQGGHDCFIFSKSAYSQYELGSACIGVEKIGKVLLLNLIFHATKFYEFRDLHLTFHLGNDRTWKSPELSDYLVHNEAELIRIFKHYATIKPLPQHPQIQKMIDRYSPPNSLEKTTSS